MLLEDIIAFGEKKTRQILVIGEAETFASQLEKTHPDGSLQVDVVKDGEKSIDKIRSRQFDCIVLDYDVTDVSLDELVREIAKARRLSRPSLYLEEAQLNDQEVENIRTNANFFVLRQANWIDRLLDATIFFTHIDHKNFMSIAGTLLKAFMVLKIFLSARLFWW